MKRVFIERNLVIVLFVLVLIIFSFAHRDTKKLSQYSSVKEAGKKLLAKTNAEKNSNPSTPNN